VLSPAGDKWPRNDSKIGILLKPNSAGAAPRFAIWGD
jgi:hypothetical protein